MLVILVGQRGWLRSFPLAHIFHPTPPDATRRHPTLPGTQHHPAPTTRHHHRTTLTERPTPGGHLLTFTYSPHQTRRQTHRQTQRRFRRVEDAAGPRSGVAGRHEGRRRRPWRRVSGPGGGFGKEACCAESPVIALPPGPQPRAPCYVCAGRWHCLRGSLP